MASLFGAGGVLLATTALLSCWSRWLAGRPAVFLRWEAAPRVVLPAVLATLLGAAIRLRDAREALGAGGAEVAMDEARLLTGLAALLVTAFLLALAARTVNELRLVALASATVRRIRASSRPDPGDTAPMPRSSRTKPPRREARAPDIPLAARRLGARPRHGSGGPGLVDPRLKCEPRVARRDGRRRHPS